MQPSPQIPCEESRLSLPKSASLEPGACSQNDCFSLDALW